MENETTSNYYLFCATSSVKNIKISRLAKFGLYFYFIVCFIDEKFINRKL